jgi:signal transduction histidine kinase
MSKHYFLGVIFCFLNSSAFTQHLIKIKPDDNLQLIGKQILFLEDKTGGLSFEAILKPENQKKFHQHHQIVFNRPASNAAFWFKLTVQNLSDEKLWLEIGDAFTSGYLDFYAPDDLSKYANPPILLGSFRPKSNKVFPSNYYCVPLSKANDTIAKTYYLKISGKFPKTHVFKVGTTLKLVQSQKKYDYALAGFLGVILAMMIYNFFLLLSIQDKIYFAYFAYLANLLWSIPFLQGYPLFHGSIFWEYFSVWHNLTYFFITLFAVYYLELRKISLKLCYWVCLLAFCKVIIFPILNIFHLASSSTLINISQLTSLLYFLSLLVVGFYVWYKGYKNALFFVLGWVFVIAGTFTFILTTNGVLPYNTFTQNSLYLGVSIEAMLFAWGLGNRYNMLKKEKELVQELNLKLTQKQNERLEQRIREHTEELRATNEELLQSNEALKLVNERLDEQSEKLKKLNHTKDKLFAIIGHDLRSPINSLKGLLHLVKDQNISPEEFLRFSTKLKDSVEHVHFTLNNLLEWANTQLQGLTTHPQISSLFPLAQENLELFQELAENKEIQIRNKITEELQVYADVNQVKLIFRNLLSNALKFTPPKGQIEVNAIKKGHFIKISMADNGMGMKPETLNSLFKHHTTESIIGTQGEKGTGLGLMLCQEFVEKNGGTIWAESELEKGSIFYFTLPAFELPQITQGTETLRREMLWQSETARIVAMVDDIYSK